jgi:hypothetical protein
MLSKAVENKETPKGFYWKKSKGKSPEDMPLVTSWVQIIAILQKH